MPCPSARTARSTPRSSRARSPRPRAAREARRGGGARVAGTLRSTDPCGFTAAYRSIFEDPTAVTSGSSTRRGCRSRSSGDDTQRRGRGRGDPRHDRARRTADRRHGRLRHGARHARPTRLTQRWTAPRQLRRDAADRGQPALGARRDAALLRPCRRRSARGARRPRGESPTRTSRSTARSAGTAWR